MEEVIVALYCRCSTRKQDLDSQKSALIKWAKEQGAEYVMHEDFAVSGRKDSRHGINKLMEDARTGKFELVGIVELSRIGRSIGFVYKVVEELAKLGIKIVLTNSNTKLDYNSLEGRALVGGLSLAADLELMLIRERSQRGRISIQEKGIKTGRKLTELSLSAIYALLEKGMGYRQIARELNTSASTIQRRIASGRKEHETKKFGG